MLISTSLDKQIKIWDLHGNCLKTLCEHSRYINCVSVNSDSSILASGSNDRTIIIWDLTGALSLNSHISDIRSLLFAFSVNQKDIPQEFICPITHEIMKNPVISEDGFTYEKSAILEWFSTGKQTSPMTNAELASIDTIDNLSLKTKIDDYLKALDFDKFE